MFAGVDPGEQGGRDERAWDAGLRRLAHKFPGTAKLWKSKDAIEGPLAFAQKRKPQWKNE